MSRAVLHDFKLSDGRRRPVRAACTSVVRIERRWDFDEVRRAALALAREVEQRAPKLATSKWWKEERHGVFVDYNQNAKDRTVASAYSVRPTPDARVSAPLTWDEVDECDPADFTLASMPARFDEARRPARGDRPARRLDRRTARALRAPGPGRCAVAAALQETGIGASARPAIQAQTRQPQTPADRDRPRSPQGGCAWPGSSAGKRAIRKLRRTCSRRTCWSTPCAGATAPGRGSASISQHVPEELRPAQEPLDPDEKILSSS